MSQENVAPEVEEVDQPAPAEAVEKQEESGTSPEGADQSAEPVEGDDGEQGTEEGKKPVKNGFERRISKLTTKAREAEMEAAYWRKQALEAQEKPAQSAPAPTDEKPTFAQFNDIEAYAEAVAEWKAEKAIQKALSKRDQEQGTRSVQQTYNARVEAYRKEHPDFDEAFEELEDVALAPEIVSAVMESEVGPAISHHLALNLDTVARLNALPPHKRLIELGKLEARLEKKPANVEPTKKISAAPAPPKVPKASVTATGEPDADKDMAAWMAWRNKTAGRR